MKKQFRRFEGPSPFFEGLRLRSIMALWLGLGASCARFFCCWCVILALVSLEGACGVHARAGWARACHGSKAVLASTALALDEPLDCRHPSLVESDEIVPRVVTLCAKGCEVNTCGWAKCVDPGAEHLVFDSTHSCYHADGESSAFGNKFKSFRVAGDAANAQLEFFSATESCSGAPDSIWDVGQSFDSCSHIENILILNGTNFRGVTGPQHDGSCTTTTSKPSTTSEPSATPVPDQQPSWVWVLVGFACALVLISGTATIFALIRVCRRISYESLQ